MDELTFQESEPLTLGVEVEVQLIDSETLDLKACSLEILKRLGADHPKAKAEIFQSMLEFNTGICKNAHEVEQDLGHTIREVRQVANQLGVDIASAGTHAFADYGERSIFPAQRYADLVDRHRWIARRLLIFGLHVHVGMRSGEHAIQMNNAILHYTPMLLAMSASSPFWKGEHTELASSRITFFESVPTGGHPCVVESWDEFSNLYRRLKRAGAVASLKDMWWDIRPSPGFGTLEIRICDVPPTLTETVALTAFIHALCLYIDDQIQQGRKFRAPPYWIMRENKWRAARNGIDTKIIVNEEGDSEELRTLLTGLLQELSPIAQAHGYDAYFDLLRSELKNGFSYERQKRVFASTKCLKEVMRSLVSEFNKNNLY